MVRFCGVPVQPFNVGVIVIVAVTGEAVAFVPVNAAIFPVPLAPSPIDVVLFVQLKVVVAVLFPVKLTAVVEVFAQTVCGTGAFTVGNGFTVMLSFEMFHYNHSMLELL